MSRNERFGVFVERWRGLLRSLDWTPAEIDAAYARSFEAYRRDGGVRPLRHYLEAVFERACLSREF